MFTKLLEQARTPRIVEMYEQGSQTTYVLPFVLSERPENISLPLTPFDTEDLFRANRVLYIGLHSLGEAAASATVIGSELILPAPHTPAVEKAIRRMIREALPPRFAKTVFSLIQPPENL
jgi:hypothetical protein